MATGRVRVAYLIEQIYPGGAERQLVELLKRLDRERFDPVVIAGWGSGHLLEEIRALEVPVRFVRGHVGGGKLATLGAVAAIREVRPEIIHAYAFTANTWGALARLSYRRTKLIAGVRGPSNATGIQRVAERLLRRVPDITVSNSRFFREEMIMAGVRPDRVVVVPNGIDLTEYPYPPDRETARGRLDVPSGPVIGMVASFRPLKRWDLFLRAAAQLTTAQEVHLVCIGDGPTRSEMEQLSRNLGIDERAHFLGTRDDVRATLPALDVLISASDIEGLSNAVLEGMASGVAVVGTAVGGTPELIEHDVTGLLVPPDSVEAMASQLEELLSDMSRARAMGEAGRQRVEREFAVESCVRQTEVLYERLLAAP